MKLSIVMTYYNRPRQLRSTLYSIEKSAAKDFDIWIVDDASTDRLESVLGEFPSLAIHLIRIEPSQKTWVNPCIAYNIGFDNAPGDIVIIQNAECMHMGDVVSHAIENVTESNYVSYAAYCVDATKSTAITNQSRDSLIPSTRDLIYPMNPIGPPCAPPESWLAWFNHGRIRPIGYHWCCAISRSNLDKLKGFDERFKEGIGWDDPDLVRRVRRLGLDVQVLDESSPFVVHLFHASSHHNYEARFSKNERLYNTLDSETSYAGVRTPEITLYNHKGS